MGGLASIKSMQSALGTRALLDTLVLKGCIVNDVSWMDKSVRQNWAKLRAVDMIESEQEIRVPPASLHEISDRPW